MAVNQSAKNNQDIYILSFHCGHDASVCLLKNGVILCHLEVERLTRVKRHHGELLNNPKENVGKPWQRKGILYFIELVLKNYNLSWQDISYFAVIPESKNTNYLPIDIPAILVNHHEAHAASSFYLSPFEESLILTIDGGGNDGGGLFGYGRGNKIEIKKKMEYGVNGLSWQDSMKYWSATANGPIGTEGVLMGAAAYGRPNPALRDFIYQQITISRHLSERIIKKFLEENRDQLKLVGDDFNKNSEKDYFSYCRALQEATEMVFEDYFQRLLALRPDCRNISLAGGTVLNCIALGKILKKHPRFNFYFCPAVNDGGLTIGAALWAYYRILGHPRIPTAFRQTPYLGLPREKDNYQEIFGQFNNIEVEKNITLDQLSELIARGKIISLFNGRSESGRRALGNRSIVCDPRDPEMKKKINQKVKHRHWYRPFAPSILEEKTAEVFEFSVTSPYMSLAAPVKPDWREKIPAVVHIDGSARLQTVNEELNPFYYALIKNFYAKTGVPLVLNTSFNDNEPIVETPEDALKCFLNTEIDYLYLEGNLISKKKSQ